MCFLFYTPPLQKRAPRRRAPGSLRPASCECQTRGKRNAGKANNSQEHGPVQPFHYRGRGEKKKEAKRGKKKKNKTKKKKEKKNQLNKTPAVITAGKLERQLLEPQQTFDAADCGFRSMKEGGEGRGK